MQESRKDVKLFEKYIDILPRAFKDFPIFYTPEEKEWLEGSPFLHRIDLKIE